MLRGSSGVRHSYDICSLPEAESGGDTFGWPPLKLVEIPPPRTVPAGEEMRWRRDAGQFLRFSPNCGFAMVYDPLWRRLELRLPAALVCFPTLPMLLSCAVSFLSVHPDVSSEFRDSLV